MDRYFRGSWVWSTFSCGQEEGWDDTVEATRKFQQQAISLNINEGQIQTRLGYFNVTIVELSRIDLSSVRVSLFMKNLPHVMIQVSSLF